MKAFAEADRAKDMHGPNVAGPKATGTKYWSEIWIRLVCAVLLACHAERRHAVSSRYHVNAWISPAHASPLFVMAASSFCLKICSVIIFAFFDFRKWCHNGPNTSSILTASGIHSLGIDSLPLVPLFRTSSTLIVTQARMLV